LSLTAQPVEQIQNYLPQASTMINIGTFSDYNKASATTTFWLALKHQ